MLAWYCDAVLAQAVAMTPEATAFLRRGREASDALDAVLRRAEYGKWAGWYQGECFVGLLDPRPLPPPGGDPGGQARPAATA